MKIQSRRQLLSLKSGEGDDLNFLGELLTRKVAPVDTEGRWSMYEEIAPLHCQTPYHHHPWDEAYYLLEGELEVQVDDRILILTRGDVINIPGGTPHRLQVCSAPHAKFLVFYSPADLAEQFYQHIDQEGIESEADWERLAEIGQSHSVHIVAEG